MERGYINRIRTATLAPTDSAASWVKALPAIGDAKSLFPPFESKGRFRSYGAQCAMHDSSHERQLFTSYVFARFSIRSFAAGFSVRAVMRVLGTRGQPTPVENATMATIRGHVGSGRRGLTCQFPATAWTTSGRTGSSSN